jgi:hypothetical protein
MISILTLPIKILALTIAGIGVILLAIAYGLGWLAYHYE